VEQARERLANLLGCRPAEIIFTGGGIEANNQALIGAALANSGRDRHIITSAVEHPAVLNPLQWLEREGFAGTGQRQRRVGRDSCLADPGDCRDRRDCSITRRPYSLNVVAANLNNNVDQRGYDEQSRSVA
jgi:hypothetical protein